MNVLVIGCGSIGKRHINNLVELGHEVFAYDIDRSKEPKGVKEVGATKEKLDVVFVCTPPSTHAEIAIPYIGALPLFVEKPLTDNTKDLAKIEKAVRINKETTNMVACNMRFEPLIEEAINQIKQLGKIYSVKTEFGYYLPYWRPGTNPNKVECPGVVLDCIHELDLLMWLYGKVLDYKSFCGFFLSRPDRIDTADIILEFKEEMVANIHLDYHRGKKKRQLEWVCEKGTVTYLEKRSLRDPDGEVGLYIDDKPLWFRLDGPKEDLHNLPYMKQLKYFLYCVEEKKQTFNSINRAIGVTRLALELQGGKGNDTS